MRPADLPGIEAYEHGTRARYVAGCRCDDCRAANRTYAALRAKAQRAGDWNGQVDAGTARAHLVALRAAGVGRRAIADASNISQSTIMDVVQGNKQRISARTERALLGVTAEAGMNDATLVPGAEVLLRLEAVRVESGWTRRELARRLGYKGNALQFKAAAMTARNVARVERFLRVLERERAAAEAAAQAAANPAPPPPLPFEQARKRVAELLAAGGYAGRDELAAIARGYGLDDEGDPWTLASRIRRHVWAGAL